MLHQFLENHKDKMDFELYTQLVIKQWMRLFADLNQTFNFLRITFNSVQPFTIQTDQQSEMIFFVTVVYNWLLVFCNLQQLFVQFKH